MKRDSKQVLTELLVFKAQAGDEGAFANLYELWRIDVLKLAFSILGNRDAAEEAGQLAWVGIAEGLRKLEDPARFRAWAFGILRRKCVDRIRSEKREFRKKEAYQEAVESAHEKTRQSDASLVLNELVQNLDTEDRLLVRLYYKEGFSVAELAETLGVAAGTVKSRLFKIRETLRNQLERKLK